MIVLHEGVVWKIPNRFKIKKIIFTRGPKTSITIDSIYRVLRVEFIKDLTYSELPKNLFIHKIIKNNKITEGEVNLKDEVYINDALIALDSSIDSSYYFSMFLSNSEYNQLTLESYDNGICIIVPVNPETREPQEYVSSVQDKINESGKLYIEGIKSLVNFVGIDLSEGRKYYSSFTTPYDLNPTFYLNEPIILGAFIETLEREFNEIQFYNIADKRDNSNKIKERIYYDTDIHLEKSHRFNSNILFDPVYGKGIISTIAIKFRYETGNIQNFIERRNQTLVRNFLNRIHYFSFSTDATKYYSVSDPFEFGVNWDITSIENDVSIESDQSDRVVYAFNFMADIHCPILETRESPSLIRDVIANIYIKSKE